MIELVKKQNEGYIEYTWPRPGLDRTPQHKTSYIKSFKPFDWVIGIGIYDDTVIMKTQDEVLRRLAKMHHHNGIVIGTFDGESLLGLSKGENILNLKDSDGVYITRDLIRAAKTGGAFVTYRSPSFSQGLKPYKKMSYSTSIPQWGWYLAYGIDIGRLESRFKQRKEELWESFLLQLAAAFALVFLISLSSIFFSGRFKRILADNFNYFENFFRKGIEATTKIDRSKINFNEFDVMAELANSMIDSRESAKNELLKSEITYREIFKVIKVVGQNAFEPAGKEDAAQ